MKYQPYPKRDPIKNHFPLPNEIFALGLSTGELAVYSYLMYCEDRKRFQCHPSYKTIGKAVDMSQNTVRKYVLSLEEKRLISTEPTTVYTKSGEKRNGNLLYTIRPIQEALNLFYARQIDQAELAVQRQQAAERLEKLTRVSPCEPLCGALEQETGTDPAEGKTGEVGAVLSEREKLSFRLEPEKRERLERRYTMDGSQSRRELIEHALDFYIDYLEMNDGNALLPKEIVSAISGRLGIFEDRISKLLFKLSVVTDMNVGVLADVYDFTEEGLRRRRATSVQNVKQTNGILSLEQQVRDAGDE